MAEFMGNCESLTHSVMRLVNRNYLAARCSEIEVRRIIIELYLPDLCTRRVRYKFDRNWWRILAFKKLCSLAA